MPKRDPVKTRANGAAQRARLGPGGHYAKWGRDRHLQVRYGITAQDYDRLLEAQGGGCAICGRPPATRRLDTDHDHKTGAVRGLLCHIHNRGIGLFRDNPEHLRRAADYLERTGGGKLP